MSHRLKTLGHATLVISEDGIPLLATDPWLVGSVYWRSWWLEKYPTRDELETVRDAKFVYITHSHPDHFHYPTIRALGKPSTLHPQFPRYEVTDFLASNGFPVTKLEPWRWHHLSEKVRIVSIPVPIDDSVIVIETPNAYVINLNDAVPRKGLLRLIRRELLSEDKAVIMLKSYSPASITASVYHNGKQTKMKTKEDYVRTVTRLADALGASHFVPFASQAFFNRSDTKWANEHKVRYEDLKKFWDAPDVELCEPFIDIDLESLESRSSYKDVDRTLSHEYQQKIADRESEEKAFAAPSDIALKIRKYMGELYFLRLFFRHGIGWRLTTSGAEYYYETRSRTVKNEIPPDHDVIISLPDKVLSESLDNNVLTDLGVTMFIKVETQVSPKIAYGLFLLMGLHDYGHFGSWREFMRFGKFYLPYFLPQLFQLKWMVGKRPSRMPAAELSHPGAL